ncbi:MAG: hypothetical protein ACRDGA_04530, partial [Bacteroidota bacterium]
SYYWFVESLVSTNRGDEIKRSEIRLFRVFSTDMNALFQLLERLCTTYGGDLLAMLSDVQNMELRLTGSVTKDGLQISMEELSRLIDEFLLNGTSLQARIE